jgi:DNA-binding beta-propeller fold protein YncE
VYVTDQANSRVDEFSSSGAFVRTFGSYGTNEGQVKSEAGVAVDSSGNVWVADYGNNRIEEFSSEGTLEKAFGSEGSGNGQFKGPLNIAFSGGNVYVTDSGNDRVEEFSSAGAYISQWGSAGSGNGQFNSPRGIAADPSGNLYVAELGNDRVQEFTSAGKYVTKFGTPGTGLGQLSEASGVAVSSSGAIYVTDYGKGRVEEWARSTWVPTSGKGSLSKSTSYLYEAIEGSEGNTLIVPAEVLSPTAEGVACGTKTEELKEEKDKGCHAVTFKYATATTATGENPTQWGEYMGRLTRVSFHAWNQSTKAMEEKAVAEYSYDKQGRLRAEWDPRVEASTACGKTCAALKTTYGYDAEGHVTALTPPGQQPWTFVYGTIAGDANAGRLLKVTRAHPKASWSEKEVTEKLHEQELTPKNTEGQAPKITGEPAVGVRVAASNGEWSGSPVVYAYQWEDCNSEGKACTPILGATNGNYTPANSDIGHTLIAQVTATNGGGSAEAASTASIMVVAKVGAYPQTVDSGNSLNAVSCVPATTDCVLADSKGAALYATNVSATSGGTWKSWSAPGTKPNDALACPASSLCLMAAGSQGAPLYYSPSLGGSWTSAYTPSYGVGAISCASAAFCVAGQVGFGYFLYSTSPASTSWHLEDQGTAAMKGVFCLSSSFCAIADSKGTVHIATSTSQIESSSWKETNVDGSTGLNGVACTSTTACVAVDGAGNALKLTIESSGGVTASKHDIDGTTSLTAVSCTGTSTCVATDSSGNVFVSTNSGESWTKEYALGDKLTSVSCASTSLCVTADTTGSVTAFNPAGGTGSEGEYHAPQPGATIEYRIPVSGSGAPYTLSKEEVETWGQKDANEYEDNDPVEGIAVFAPDEPQSWPATHYTRATIDYINSKGLSVNAATPTGGIATTEYNEVNEAVRTLNADNRAAAMKEGCKSVAKKECRSAEVSEKLDTKAEYNAFGSEIVKVLGPEHEVKLSTGEEVEARGVTHSYYDEGAKGAEEKNKETYNLITKTTSAALLANGEEKDMRTNTSSYSGQEDLGWKLRKPTSVTTDPVGLSLTSTTKYSETTGDVEETQTPAVAGKDATIPPTYTAQFGVKGTGAGQLEKPTYDAIDAHGNVWVVEYADNRLSEFSASGTFIEAVGWGVSNGEAKLEVCTSSCKAGIAGTGKGQLAEPDGIAIAGGEIYVVDSGNDRIEMLNEKGEWVTQWGSLGTGAGQFKIPLAIAVSPTNKVWVGDSINRRVEEFSSTGSFIEAIGWGVSNGKAEYEVCTSSCQAGISGSGNGQFSATWGMAFAGSNLYVADTSNHRVEEFNEKSEYVAKFGSSGKGNGQLEFPTGVAVSPTTGLLYVTDTNNNRMQVFTQSGSYLTQFASAGAGNGQLQFPEGDAVNSSGEVIVVDDLNHRVEKWVPSFTGNEGAHETRTIYYTAKEEAEVTTCRNHPEWAGLICQIEPISQPDRGLPEVPITTVALYNLWGEAEKTEEKFATGSKAVTRTKTETYDPAGRALTSEVTASPATDTALPKVSDEYNAETGAVEKQSTSEGTITSNDNTVGQLTEYKDASGNVAKYTYEEGGDGRLEEVSEGKGEEAKSSATYSYSATTGFMEKLVDTAAEMTLAQGTFTASYDVEGKMTNETYPNNMKASYSINSVGQTTGLVYEKNADCASKCPETWFSDSVVRSIHGETLQQASTLAKESYAFDNAGRLLEAQETPVGKGCAVRLYAYDEESNRTSETKREPGTEGKCATEGGSVERHTYDEANRLADEGIEYETFGNATKMPSGDAGGHEIVSTYYVDNQLASEEQNKQLVDYKYDPMGRTIETASENKETKAKANVVSHYAGSGNALTWTSEGTEKWTRNIPGIDGTLSATQEVGKAPVLQLHDLEGNIVGVVEDKETVTKLASTYNSTEFGVPNEGKTPPKYAWLGAAGVSTETSFGSGAATQAGAAYVPQVARALQTAPVVPPGAFPNGSPGTQFTAAPVTAGAIAGAQEVATQFWQQAEAERQRAREEEANRAAFENAGDPWYTVVTYTQMWRIIDELNGMVKNDDNHEAAISEAPGIGQYIDLSWNTYKESVLEPEIYRLEEEAKQMEREYQTGWFTEAFFVQYKKPKIYLPGPESLITGEDETVYIPWNLSSEPCSNEGTWGSGENPANYTTYFLCASGVQRSAQGWPYD